MSKLPLVDLVVTHYPKNERRVEIAHASLRSLLNCTHTPYRLTWVCDGGSYSVPEAHRNIICKTNRGLGPSVNEAMAAIQAENTWYEQRGEMENVSSLVCYLQDDIQYSVNWLINLVTMFAKFEPAMKIGFATGIECPEHAVKKEIGTFGNQRVLTKDWIRMTCMLARREYWMSMLPIHGMDPETQQKRARPHDGMGSGCDWWLIRNHPNSVCRTGRTNLVVPGLLTHMGYKDSTWLSRDLPESDEDKRSMGDM